MAAYALAADLDAKWGAEQVDLAAWSAQLKARDPARVDASLAAAGAVIESYLARRYRLPLAPTDEGALLLKTLCCDLAMAELATTPGTRNDIIAEAAKTARSLLADVAAAKCAIPLIAPPTATPEIAPNMPELLTDERVMTRSRLRDL